MKILARQNQTVGIIILYSFAVTRKTDKTNNNDSFFAFSETLANKGIATEKADIHFLVTTATPHSLTLLILVSPKANTVNNDD